ncbi:unnamed protein product [Blepharisma stoltei]|uniref:Uncharacterized protein n=1 Tax=Blepharisma stoltei TaxID=1481888 RepID=A0AAU9K6C4_9CILI|nr:unnamed protein product [Blepharisma stoltei]
MGINCCSQSASRVCTSIIPPTQQPARTAKKAVLEGNHYEKNSMKLDIKSNSLYQKRTKRKGERSNLSLHHIDTTVSAV